MAMMTLVVVCVIDEEVVAEDGMHLLKLCLIVLMLLICSGMQRQGNQLTQANQ